MRKELWEMMDAISDVYEVDVCYINPLNPKDIEDIENLEKEAKTPEEKEMAAMFSEMPKYHLFACRCQAKSDKIGSSESNCAHLDAFGLEADFDKSKEYSSNQGVLREWIEAFIKSPKDDVTKFSWSVPVFSTYLFIKVFKYSPNIEIIEDSIVINQTIFILMKYLT